MKTEKLYIITLKNNIKRTYTILDDGMIRHLQLEKISNIADYKPFKFLEKGGEQ
jgi:hypothetical protein